MPWYIDAKTKIRALVYDKQSETWKVEEVTVADALEAYSDEECPVPAEVQEVKHGEWVPLENNKFQCSECGNQAISSNPSIDVARDLHYCWSCGAKMDGKVQK